MKKFLKAFKKKKVWIPVVSVLAVLLIFMMTGKQKDKPKVNNDVIAERRDIVSTITGTATILPKDTYSVTSLVTGDIVRDSFSEGDLVKKGDVLYTVDTKDVSRNLKSAQLNYKKAQQSYNDAKRNVSDLKVTSNMDGTIKKIYVTEGANVGAGSPVCDIYDSTSMKIKVPFNERDCENIFVGDTATLSVVGSSETLLGTVTEVNTATSVKNGYMKVRYVTIKASTPFALSETDRATAVIKGISCNDAGTFQLSGTRTISANVSGRVEKINITEGNFVRSGEVIVTLSSDQLNTQLSTCELNLEEAQLSLSKAQSVMDDYKITAPISGTVVTKNIKAGDKLSNAGALTEMAVIYDMSSLKFDISVDELDINRITLGQEVTVSADAIGGKEYRGSITNISINGKTASGVTTYPVSVEITEFDDDLIPGMNVDVEIITDKAQNVVCVPVSSVVRNNLVYIKGEKQDDKDTAPEGYRSVKVETGVYNGEFIEIKSGINEGDIVYSESKTTGFADEMMKMMGPMGGGEGGAPIGPPH